MPLLKHITIKFPWRHPLPLQTKLFLAYFISAEIMLFSFALFFYYYVSPILIRNEVNTVTALNDTFLQQIDDSLNGLDIVSTNINYSSLMADKLDESFQLEINQDNLPGLADLFVTINGTDLKADQINLYDLEGNVVQVGLITTTNRINLSDLTWLEKTKSLSGTKLIGNPYYTAEYSVGSTSPDWFLSLYRTYKNPYGRYVGAVETTKRCRNIFNPIIVYNKRTDNHLRTYVFNGDGEIMYPYDCLPEDVDAYTQYTDAIQLVDGSDSWVNQQTGETERVIWKTSPYSSWAYVTVLPESTILEPVSRLKSWLLAVVAMIFLLSVWLAYLLAQNMVRPVKSLKNIIQKLELETLGTLPENDYTTAYNELDEVYHAFQFLSKKLKVSMDELIDTRQQELKSRTLALQSQTNPHFYYNTLSNIIVLAEEERNEEVIQLCRNLTQIMRYITDTASSLVTLREEMTYVEKYLYCMKVRYQDSLTVHIDIPPDLLDQKVPKLIIQPLVENAIKYGTDCIPPWYIHIDGKLSEDQWTIQITDSGTGFDQCVLKRIQQRINYINKNPGMPEMKIDGLGMINVYLRWKIHTKDRFLFNYRNTEDGHGQVIIGMKNDMG